MADYMDTTASNAALNNAFASNATNALDAVRSTTPTNPNAELKQEDFLALLLTELQYQDPTDPMDTQNMLEQTSMLSQLSMQMKTNEVMEKLATQMESSFSMTAMNALGSYAVLNNTVTKDDATTSLGIPLNFDEDISGGVINIKNSSGTVVRQIELGAMEKGATTINWDLLSNNKNTVDNGTYSYEVNYTNTAGETKDMSMKNFLVEAVRFQNGKAQIKVGGSFIDIDKVSEFNAWAQS